MIDRERETFLREWLDKWGFDLFPLMPIAEEDAEVLRQVFKQIDNDRRWKHTYDERKKNQAFIKGVKHEEEIQEL